MKFKLALTPVLALAVSAACAGDPQGDSARVEAPAAKATTIIEPSTTETAQLAAEPRRAREVATCSSHSEASFPGAFRDPGNAVAEPFVLVGGARFTSASVIASHGGQKYPVLVRAGRTVTLRVAPSARGHVSLGYGSLPQGEVSFPDGHAAVTFVACRPDEDSGSSVGPGEWVTFWSGFVFAIEPSCAPLDVHVGGKVSRIEIPLGDRC